MAVLHFKHRFLIRQYAYPVLFFFMLLLLVRWNFAPRAQPTGRQFDDGGGSWDVARVLPRAPAPTATAAKAKTTAAIVEHRPPAPTKPAGNVVSLAVYMEAQCPDTTGFVRRNLMPTWRKLGHLNRLNVTVIPFGKATCTPAGEDFTCECQHGPSECELNALMNCAIENRVHARDYLPLIGCIQGQDDLNTAAVQCLNGDASRDWLVQCATSRRGRYLLAMAGQRTAQLGEQFNFVPWVVLNGQRDIDSFYALHENVCKQLQPPPVECQTESLNQIQRV
ncbi:Interferon gamma-inducible thiol reductase [Aphelenchoides fujianensis]|nr:Interferon gamma-inducible thiol reductase [Aphelenchoides fujianensis]